MSAARKIPARRLLFVAAATVLVVIAAGVFLPSEVRVERGTTIDAPPATVFALISDVHRMQEWLPWIEEASGGTRFAGPRRGPGAIIEWSPRAGESCRQTVVESAPFDTVVTELVLCGHAAAGSRFRLDAADNGTRLTWSFDEDVGLNLVRRYLRPVLAGRVAQSYEEGLAELKTMAESLPRADFADLELEHMLIDPVPIAYVTTNSMPGAAAVSEAMGQAFYDVLRFIDRHGLQEAGPPLSISREFSGARLVFDAAIPVRGIPDDTVLSGNGVRLGESYGGPVIRVTHRGSYGELARTHEKIAAYLAAYAIERNGAAWESYVSDPGRTPQPELLTYVYYPVKEAPAE